MRALRRFLTRLGNLATRWAQEDRLREEIDEHIALQTAENLRAGLSPVEARRQAMLKFGGVEAVKEEYRAERRILFIDTLLHDIRYALRALRKSPGFTAAAVLTLALGIGANTAIFSVVNATLLASLPFEDSSRLVNLWGHASFFDSYNLGLSVPDVNDIRSQSKSLSAVIPYQYATVDLTGRNAPRELEAARVPADFFSLLGFKPLYGRTFLPLETQRGADREAILSGALWHTQFGSDPSVVGTSIMLDGKPYIVVGIMPQVSKIMSSPAMVDIWTPFAPSPAELTIRGMHDISVMARLNPGVTVRQAQTELDGIAARLAKSYPNDDEGWSFRADSLRTDMNQNTRTPLLILLGVVGLVLLIACANVGNLFLSRGWARRRELAIRSTLGATRGRLIRQSLVESSLLALMGGACGLLLGSWGIDALTTLAPTGMVAADKVAIDTNVLLFTLSVSILAGLLFGLAPAFLFSWRGVAVAMKENSAGSQTGAYSSRQNPLRQILVVTEIALALVLVIGATLALRSFSHLLRVNLGFNTERVLALRLSFPATKFKTSDDMFAYVRTLVDRLRATSGVESASVSGHSPLSGSHGEGTFTIEGESDDPRAQTKAEWSTVGPGYFQTLGISLLRGRDFTNMDGPKTTSVLVVNQSFAQKFFGELSPIGQRISRGDEDAQHHKIWDEIVGEVADVRDLSPRAAPQPEMYSPFYQSGFSAGKITRAELLLRTRANPEALVSAAQGQVWALDKNQPISKVQTMQERVAVSVSSQRFQSFLLGAFGALGLLLAIVGIYGVISYSVIQRTHEIGIRMALGAEPRQVMRLILAHGLKLALIGEAIGVGASLGLTRLMASVLFDVSAADPLTFVGVAILLAIVALAACWIPACRAMRVEPMVALRFE